MIAIVDFGKHIMGHCFVIIKIWSVSEEKNSNYSSELAMKEYE